MGLVKRSRLLIIVLSISLVLLLACWPKQQAPLLVAIKFDEARLPHCASLSGGAL
jgi:hypothetical protein